jgi:hypothetical protein
LGTVTVKIVARDNILTRKVVDYDIFIILLFQNYGVIDDWFGVSTVTVVNYTKVGGLCTRS